MSTTASFAPMFVPLWMAAIPWVAGFVVIFVNPGFILRLVGVEKPSVGKSMFVRRFAIPALIVAAEFIGALLRRLN